MWRGYGWVSDRSFWPPVRVVLPMFDVAHYRLWVTVSQGLWILAFGWLTLRYLPILIRPWVDGRDG